MNTAHPDYNDNNKQPRMKTRRVSQWEKKLTLTEIKHLREEGCHTLDAFTNTARHQAHMRKKFPDPGMEPCRVCRSAAQKLGLPV